MRNSALQERRNRQILADIVRAYIETGEPVSSRAISKAFEESLSTATIRNVMADLEDGGFLYQPHTSAGRVPTAAAYRFFAQEIASQATITAVDREWIQREMGGATSAAEITERAGHVLAEVSNGLGIIVSPPLGKTVLEHARMWLLPDGRVVVVLISRGGNTRDKILRPSRLFTQDERDATAEFLNRHYSGWTLEAIRGDLLQKLATERERYEGMAQSALSHAFVALALRCQLLQKVAPNRFQRPAGIVPVQKLCRRVPLILGEQPAWPQDLVTRIPATRDQHHHHATVRQQPHSSVFQNSFAQRWRHNDAQAVGHFRQHVSGAFGDFRCTGRTTHLPLNPFAVHRADRGLRRNLLGKKPVGRGRRHAPRRSVGLIQKTAILQVRHDIANRRGAQHLLKTFRNRARGHRLARLDVRAHDVRQNLAVPPFLERRIPHSSTLLLVLKSAPYIVGSVPGGVNMGSIICPLPQHGKKRKGQDLPCRLNLAWSI